MPTEKEIKNQKECWFSFEAKEEYEIEEREKNALHQQIHTSLTNLPLSFSNKNNFIVENKEIHRKGENRWEICIFGHEMDEGIYRLNFCVYGNYFIGLVDSSKRLPSNGANITENHIGLLNLCTFTYIVIICVKGVGICHCLYIFFCFS